MRYLLFLLAMLGLPTFAATPDLPTIMNGVIARDRATQDALKAMQYHQTVVTERLDAKNKATAQQTIEMTVRPGAKPSLEILSVKGDNIPTNPDEAAQQAKGKEMAREQQTFDLHALAGRFNITLQGTVDLEGRQAYLLAFEPKANQPYHTQTEKVLNQLHGHMWVATTDYLILRTEATLLHPVQVAWIFASIKSLDFHYDLPPGGSAYGPAWLETTVDVEAPMVSIRQHQRVNMNGFQARTPAPAVASTVGR